MIKEKKILKNYIIYFAFALLICIIGISKVFAYEYENVGYFNDKTQVQVEVNYTSNPITVPINAQYQLAEVYSLDMFLSNINLDPSYVYFFEIYLPNTILSRANQAQVINQSGNTSVNCSVITTYFANNYPHVTFKCDSQTNITSLYIKFYNSNNQYLFDPQIFTWNYSYLRRRVPESNDNTAEIIDGIQSSTQDIINNQNQSTQDIIDSQKVCNTFDASNLYQKNKFLNDNGEISNVSGTWGITNFINIQNSTIEVLRTVNYTTSTNTCFYNNQKEKVSCTRTNNIALGNFVIPDNSYYVRFTIDYTNSRPQFKVCSNGNQATTNAINDLDNTLKDDSVDENGVADAFDNFNSFLDDNSTITQLITLPITLYTAILNNLNGTCQPFNLGELYGNNLILPCINISQYLGNSLWTMIDIIISGFAIYAISRKMIKVFNNFSSLREGDVIDD